MMNGTNSANAVSDLLTKFDDSKRAVAKLMARENITVQIVNGADTARFDTVHRVLTLPNWSSMSVDQADLLLAHEVGHALFTDNSYLDAMKEKTSAGLFSYINVVEDARIERKMKNAFPGLARVFYNGYREFHANGPIFKGTRTHLFNPRTGQPVAIASMKFIDRINVFFKIGAFVDVPFSAAERAYLRRIEKAADLADVIQIAKELHKLAKETNDAPAPPPPSQSPDSADESDSAPGDDPDGSDGEAGEDDADTESGDDADETDDASGDDESEDATGSTDADETDEDATDSDSTASGDAADGDDADETESGGASTDDSDDAESGDAADGDETDSDDADGDAGDDESDDADGDAGDGAGSGADNDPTAETDDDSALREAAAKASESAKETLRHLIWNPLPTDVLAQHIIPANDYTARCAEVLSPVSTELDKLLADWSAQYVPTARLMAQEFDRRKNARQMQRASVAKTGKLNVNKLHAYKFTDDLFTRMTVMPRGQSHGIVMIIDASGSMSSVFGDVLDQMLLFAHFAFHANIPFASYMFTDNNYGTGRTVADFSSRMTPGSLMPASSAKLVGLIDTTVSRGQFKSQVRTVLALRSRYDSDGNWMLTNAAASMPYAGLGGTPLLSGIMLAESVIARMKSMLHLDKMVLAVISDGEDGDGLRYASDEISHYDVRRGAQSVRGNIVVRDSVTKRNFHHLIAGTTYNYLTSKSEPATLSGPNAEIQILLDIIKARHAVSTIHIHLIARSTMRRRTRWQRQANVTPTVDMSTIRRPLPNTKEFGPQPTMETVRASFDADGHYIVSDGIADLTMVIPAGELELTENEFEKLDTEGMSRRQIAKKFEDSLTGRVGHRKFVNAVMPFIA